MKPTPPASTRTLPLLLALLGILLLVFIRSLSPDLTLSVGDDSLTVMRNMYRMKDLLFSGTWGPINGLGFPSPPPNLAPGYFLTFLVPFFKYVEANALFHLFLAGIGGFFLIRDLTGNRFASFMGGVFLMLQPHVLSHLLPGHVGHFLMAGWIPLLVLFTRRAVLQGGLNWLYAGACAGAMLAAGQYDVGAFFMMLIMAYGLFLVIRHRRERQGFKRWAGLALGVACAGALAVLMAWQAMFANLLQQLQASKAADAIEAAPEQVQDPAEKWFWATQWSFPPVESADIAIPGFFGWGSSDPVNPYRGRVGQTEGWLTHHQGMPNLNDVCQYLGAALLMGLLLALLRRRRDPETWFFAAAGLLALILSFGKFGPLYRLFFNLPGMDTLRNPIKWYYITSLCAGILGALGYAEATRRDSEKGSRLSGALLAFLPGAAVILLGVILLARMEQNPFPLWQRPELTALSAASLGKAALFWGAAGLAFFLMLTSPRTARQAGVKIGAGLALVVMLTELIYVNSHYMPYHEWKPSVNAGPFQPFLDSAPRSYRTRFLRQDGPFYQLREIAVMEGLETADPYPSRLADEYLLLQRRMEQADPVRFWRLCNVRYIVAPGPLQDPRFKTLLSLQAGKTPIVVSELKTCLPRCIRVATWKAAPRSRMSDLMVDPAFDPGHTALLQDDAAHLPAAPETPDTNAVCRVVSYETNRIQAETDSTQAGIVVFLTRYDDGWKAFVDDQPTPILKANGILQACEVPPGKHTVEWRFRIEKSVSNLRVTLTGWLIALTAMLAGAALAWRRGRVRPN